MPASTAKGFPYPLSSDPFLPATVDFPALAAAIDAKTAREMGSVLSAAPVLDVGVSGQIRAGRSLLAADFTTLLGLSTPIGLFNLADLTNLGSGGALTNKGTVPFAKGINGVAASAALFAGSTGQALYISDTGGGDPFRIKTGSWGAWFRTAKRGTGQFLVTKEGATGAASAFGLVLNGSNLLQGDVVIGSSGTSVVGVTDVADDRWHFGVVTFDGGTVRLYVDGTFEASIAAVGSINTGATAPFNIGGWGADGSTAAGNPHFGRVAVAFVTADVLDETQIRLLMSAKIAHGYAVTPTRAVVAVRRRKRGGPLVVGDFSASPRRLYNFTGGAMSDGGLDGANLTNNGAAVSVAGADGAAGGAMLFNGSSQYLSATDAGLPSGTGGAVGSRSIHAWFKSASGAAGTILTYGTATAGQNVTLSLTASGAVQLSDGTTTIASAAAYNDGQWHHVVFTRNNDSDGLRMKVYVDGRFVAGSTNDLSSTVLSGVLRIGTSLSATNYFAGAIDGVGITDYTMAQDEITSLFAKGSLAVPASPKNPGDHVEAMDASNVYVLHGSLDPQFSVDLAVAA